MTLLATCLACCFFGSSSISLGQFESGIDGWRFSNGAEFPGAKGELVISDETPTGKGHSAEIRFDFSEGGAYVGAYVDFDPLDVENFSMMIKKPRPATLTFRVVDSTNQTLQKSVNYGHGDWQKVIVGMSGWTGHWGGANDGIVHQPVKTMGILVESRGLESPTGSIFFDEVWANMESKVDTPKVIRSEYLVTDFTDESGWRCGGAGRLENRELKYVFDGQNRSVWLSNSISLLGKPVSITFRAKGGVPGDLVKIRLGSHFQTFERELGVLTGDEVSFTVPMPPEHWRYYGGENDGVVRYPLRVQTLIIERGARDGSGIIEEMELLATTEVPDNRAVFLVADHGEPVEANGCRFTCRVWNLLPDSITGKLEVKLSNWDEKMIGIDVRNCIVPSGGKTDQSFTFTLPENTSFAEAQFTFLGHGQIPSEAVATFTAPINAEGSPDLQPDSPWGMGLYLYRYPNTPNGLDEMRRAAQMAQAAGVKWSREEFSWSRTEPEKGRFDWSFYDRLVETAHDHGISIYGLLTYWSHWTKAYTEEGIDDFCDWARAAVAHFKGRIKHWEIYNEPNIFFWQGPKELYPVLLKRAYKAIKEVDPEAQVLGCSTAGIDRNFIQMCIEKGAPFDILTIHPYRSSLDEVKFISELRRTAELVNNRPVWITEMGWPTHVGGTTERDQAELLARCYLSAVASGACSNISWYDFRNDGVDPFYNEHNFGVIRRDFSPKPAYRALAMIGRLLPRPRNPHISHPDDSMICMSFETDFGPVSVMWSRKPQLASLKIEGDDPIAFNLIGDHIPLVRRDGSVWMMLMRNAPVILMGATSVEKIGNPISVSIPDAVKAGSTVTITVPDSEGIDHILHLPQRWEVISESSSDGETQKTIEIPEDDPPGRKRLLVIFYLDGSEFVWAQEVEIIPDEVKI